MLNEKELIDGCKKYNRVAQKVLYTKYCAKMYAICMRYLKNKEEAEDLLQDGFIKVFININKYSSTGSLEGWIRRVIVNVVLNHLLKKKRYKLESIENHKNNYDGDAGYSSQIEHSYTFENSFDVEESEFTKPELDKALDQVPEVYSLVFNLFHIDDLTHSEIATLLSIDEATSRTRLFRAKKILQQYLIEIREKKRYREQLS
jgi:RNA polymerase sigma-70 factor, ECF subfamily